MDIIFYNANIFYKTSASLVDSNWVEETTNWTDRPEYLGTSTLIYINNPSLQSEILLDLTKSNRCKQSY